MADVHDNPQERRPQATQSTPHGGHEPETTSIRALVIFFIALVIALIVTCTAMVVLFHSLKRQAERLDPLPSPFQAERTLPPPPRLQVDHELDMHLLREHQQRMLSAFGWVDREAGVVRIPIEHAMELYLKRQAQQLSSQTPSQQNSQQQQQQQPSATSPVQEPAP